MSLEILEDLGEEEKQDEDVTKVENVDTKTEDSTPQSDAETDIEEEGEEAKDFSIECGGTALEVKDGKGHTWAIPPDTHEDYDDLFADDGIDKVTEHFAKIGFWAQTIRTDQIDEYLGEGYVIITRDEMDLPTRDIREYGIPVTNALTRGPDVWIKIPLILKERQDKRIHARIKAEMKAIEPTEEMIRQAEQQGFPVISKHSRKNYGEIEDQQSEVKSIRR